MTFNTEDKNGDELLQEIKTLRTEIQMISGYMEALYLMIKDLAEYDSDKTFDRELVARTVLYDSNGLDKEDV